MKLNRCTLCGELIVLSPTAEERAKADVSGKSAAYYTALFTEHAACALAKREQDTLRLLRSMK